MLKTIVTGAVAGAVAGAAGTTALNAATYVDMAARGRPASSAPEEVVERTARRAGVTIPGEGDERDSRVSGLGALSGIGAGLATGTIYGVARALGWRPPLLAGALVTGAAAMLGADGPIAGLGVSDPREWGPADWASDAIPHAVYGLVTAGACAALLRSGRG